MGEASLRFFRQVNFLSRFAFKHRVYNQFYRIHSLPLKTPSPELLVDVTKSEVLWNRHNDGLKNFSLIKHLNECFMRNDEIINYAVDLLSCASNRSSSSYSFMFALVNTLDDYIKKNEIFFSPSLHQKSEALLSVLHYHNYQLIQLVCSVFKINDQAQAFKSTIENMIQQQKIVEAAYCVAALHMQEEFEIEKILLPLLLETKLHSAYVYLANYPVLQLKSAKLMDEYLKKDISSTYINSKKVFRTLTALVNMFKVPLVHCPNLHLIRSKSAINILVNRRAEQSVSEETWNDMIQSVVGDNNYLQKFLIKKLVKKNDMKTAQKIAEAYNINDPALFISTSQSNIVEKPTDLEINAEDLTMSCEMNVLDNEDKPNIHLEFTLRAEDITFISDQHSFVKCLDEIAENYTMIGIDSEWKPHFGLSRDRLSLIQLAGHDKVFILDVLSLTECLDVLHWDKLLDSIFGNPNIIKLGCGIMADVNMILDNIKGSTGKTIKFSHMLDIALFYQKLQEVYPDKLNESGNDRSVRSLSFLCDKFLGKPLNKEERLCNWEQRPLKASQLQYAALDAHCLLQIYDKLKEDSLKEGINFDHLAKVAIVLTNQQWKPKRRFKGITSDRAFHIHSTIPIANFKIAIDSAFESQGKELRKLGADVIILRDDDAAAESALKLCKSEGRIIICTKSLWNQVKDNVPEGLIHNFESTSENPVTVSHFLQHFNVKVSVKNIFTRCMICNSCSGMRVNYEDLKKLLDLEGDNTTSMNSLINSNLSCFSPDLRIFLMNLLTSNINIKFASLVQTLSVNDCAFLCKTCGNIC